MKLTGKQLRDNGWKEHPEGIGWVKNGAFYGPGVNVVGQFLDDPNGRSVQMDFSGASLRPKIVLHFINAFASAGDLT